MSTSRRLYDVVVEPSVADLFRSPAQSDSSRSQSGKLPSLFTFSYNFKPDSAADSTRGALFVPGPNQSDAAEFQLELDHGEVSAKHDSEVGKTTSSGKAGQSSVKTAHIFSGPQLPSKTLDLVLLWDETSNSYRLDRLASSFAFKAERSRTTSSSEAMQVWSDDAKPPKRRKITPTTAASTPSLKPSAPTTPSQSYTGSPLLRGRTAVRGQPSGSATGKAAPSPYRQSTGFRVEPEVFEDTPPASARTSPQSRPVSVPRHATRLNRTSSIPEPHSSEEGEEQGDTSLENALALQLESELTRELNNADSDSEIDQSGTSRILANVPSPHSRLQQGGRFGQADTPRAHSPELDDLKATSGSLRRQSLAASLHKAVRPSDKNVQARPAARTGGANASIGLGLHQTGTGITPITSPLIDTANLDNDDEGDAEVEGDGEDDDLDDFAAQLDMSLAEEPQAIAARERRKSTHSGTDKAINEMSRSQRRAYGLGGPRLEEQDLEDSD